MSVSGGGVLTIVGPETSGKMYAYKLFGWETDLNQPSRSWRQSADLYPVPAFASLLLTMFL